MFGSIRVKFTFVFGSLIVFLFLIFGIFLLDSKEREMTTEISRNVQTFANLSVEQVMDQYFTYLEPGNFISFQSELNAILRQNINLDSLSIVTYNGVILFDSKDESTSAYSGSLRTIQSEEEINRVKSNYFSIKTEEGLFYGKFNNKADLTYIDVNENVLSAPSSKDRIQNITVPFDNSYAVIYSVNYKNLDQSLAMAKMQIFIVALLGLIFTLMLSFILSSSITRPIKALKEGALKIGKGNFKARVNVKSKDEIGLLAGTFNKMAKELENATEAMLYKERVKKELELAGQIQKELLPAERLILNNLDIAGGLYPANEVGGDAFDYIKTDEDSYIFYLGDVTGHGVPAGIVSSIVNAMLYMLRKERNIIALIQKINEVIRAKTAKNVFMTMIMCFWDDKKCELSYVNAGHPPILYYDASAKKVFDVPQEGMALGFVDDISSSIKPQIFKPKKDDILLMYSDGILEAKNPKGEQYGMMRFKRIVQDAGNDLFTAEGIKNAVLSDVVEFIGNKEHDDDITLLVLKAKS